MILITGAAGKTGRAVIRELANRGQEVRGLVHGSRQVGMLERLGLRDIAIGEMTDQVAMNRAADGAEAIYHICPNMHPAEVKIGEIVIRAAQLNGVERFVYQSVLHPQIEAMPHHWQKLRVEEMLIESRLSFTIMQPAAYMQNLLANWDHIVGEGVYEVPYALDTRISMVDLLDVAEAAATVLIEEAHESAVYELCGPRALSQREVAAMLSAKLERPVQAEAVPIAQWEYEARSAGLSNYAVETLIKMFRHYERYNFSGSSNVLGWLLGRRPHTFAQFLERTVSQR